MNDPTTTADEVDANHASVQADDGDDNNSEDGSDLGTARLETLNTFVKCDSRKFSTLAALSPRSGERPSEDAEDTDCFVPMRFMFLWSDSDSSDNELDGPARNSQPATSLQQIVNTDTVVAAMKRRTSIKAFNVLA